MKIERHGATLTVKLNSGIGWNVHFSHDYDSDADAEAWRVHLQNQLDSSREAAEATDRRMIENSIHLHRRIASLRGTITRMKRRNANG